MFAQRAGVKVIHIPFTSSPDAIQDVAGARSAFYMAWLLTVDGLLKVGKLLSIAVASASRVASLPTVPTLAVSGCPGFSALLWVVFWAPASTPSAVVAKPSADQAKALQSPECAAPCPITPIWLAS